MVSVIFVFSRKRTNCRQ